VKPPVSVVAPGIVTDSFRPAIGAADLCCTTESSAEPLYALREVPVTVEPHTFLFQATEESFDDNV
jgi:hypothetical protein